MGMNQLLREMRLKLQEALSENFLTNLLLVQELRASVQSDLQNCPPQ